MAKRIRALAVVVVVSFVLVVVQSRINSRVVEGSPNVVGNMTTLTFGDTGIKLVTTIESRNDGLINFNHEVRCADGTMSPWTYGIGYEPERFTSSFEPIRAKYQLDEDKSWILYDTRDNSYRRPTGCK